MWKVDIIQDESMVTLRFNEMCDALKFTEFCLECGDDNTKIVIKSEKED